MPGTPFCLSQPLLCDKPPQSSVLLQQAFTFVPESVDQLGVSSHIDCAQAHTRHSCGSGRCLLVLAGLCPTSGDWLAADQPRVASAAVARVCCTPSPILQRASLVYPWQSRVPAEQTLRAFCCLGLEPAPSLPPHSVEQNKSQTRAVKGGQ